MKKSPSLRKVIEYIEEMPIGSTKNIGTIVRISSPEKMEELLNLALKTKDKDKIEFMVLVAEIHELAQLIGII